MRKQVSTATLQVAIKIEHAHAHVDPTHTHAHPHTLRYASGARWRHLRGALRRIIRVNIRTHLLAVVLTPRRDTKFL